MIWRDSAVRRLGLARFISHTGGTAAFFVGIWGRAAFEFQASAAGIALVMAVIGVAQLAGTAVAGVLIDRFTPRRVLVAAEVVFAPATLALVLADDLAQLTALVGLGAFVAAVVMTAVTSFPPFLTEEPDQLQRANSAIEIAGTSAFVAGPAIGALLAETLGIDAIFVFDAATSLVAVALLVGLQQRRTAASGQTSRGRMLSEAVDGFRFAYRMPLVRFCLLVGSLSWLLFGVFGAAEPIFFREVLHGDAALLGWVNAVFGVGLGAGAVAVGKFPPQLLGARALAVFGIASGLGAVLYTVTDQLPVVVVGAVTWGFVLGLLLPAIRTAVQRATPEAMVGRAMAALHIHHTFGEIAPLLFMPAVVAVLGAQRALVTAGVVAAVGALLALLPARRLPLETAPPPAVGPALTSEPFAPLP